MIIVSDDFEKQTDRAFSDSIYTSWSNCPNSYPLVVHSALQMIALVTEKNLWPEELLFYMMTVIQLEIFHSAH